jgi:hypothetical protein
MGTPLAVFFVVVFATTVHPHDVAEASAKVTINKCPSPPLPSSAISPPPFYLMLLEIPSPLL